MGQEKSATGNAGTFSSERNHIRFQASVEKGSREEAADKKKIEANENQVWVLFPKKT